MKTIYIYTKDHAEYERRYDEITVWSCRRLIKLFEIPTDEKGKKFVERLRATLIAQRISIYCESGERYLQKGECIKEWIDEDKRKDAMVDQASTSENIYCLQCSSIMQPESKQLWDSHNEEMKVLFTFRCTKGCKRGRGIFEDGTEWKLAPALCPHCKHELQEHVKHNKKQIITIEQCKLCKYENKEVLDLTEKIQTPDPCFEEDRKKFCLSPKEGEEYRIQKVNMQRLGDLKKEIEERAKHKKVYEAVANIQKLTIFEMEELLNKQLEEGRYINTTFEKPSIGKDVIVEFSVIDSKKGRTEYDSKLIVKKIIQKALENTNWRLMSDGIAYRLGCVTGRLRCLEKEEDLISMMKIKMKGIRHVK